MAEKSQQKESAKINYVQLGSLGETPSPMEACKFERSECSKSDVYVSIPEFKFPVIPPAQTDISFSPVINLKDIPPAEVKFNPTINVPRTEVNPIFQYDSPPIHITLPDSAINRLVWISGAFTLFFITFVVLFYLKG